MNSIAYLTYYLDCFVYLCTNLVTLIVALLAYQAIRRAGLLMLAASSLMGLLGGIANLAIEHVLKAETQPYGRATVQVVDMVAVTIGTIGIVLILRAYMETLRSQQRPPPLQG